MNIQEDYVSFETAKLLKEKGFDEKCNYVWKLDKASNPQDTDGISKICAERFMEGESFVDNSDIKKVSEYEDWLEDYHKAYLCPTLQMAMKWLREVHYIHIAALCPIVDVDTDVFGVKYNVVISNLKNNCLAFNTGIEDNEYDTYEQACEEAIKYCLENLI